jgi:alkanesulfonate monooxygenase SsuD/methylene tetrahydromethanopterin reductase-like flavin-dependent oxidoreductase (luciferase family)
VRGDYPAHSPSPLVACTGFRNPALLAKIADSLDEVSDGRVLLGLGAGWHEPEHTAYGYPFDRRVSRFEEALQIIVPMVKGENVTFHGQF